MKLCAQKMKHTQNRFLDIGAEYFCSSIGAYLQEGSGEKVDASETKSLKTSLKLAVLLRASDLKDGAGGGGHADKGDDQDVRQD
eukprot:6190787-Pleurochrysis_carterae.AAC.2